MVYILAKIVTKHIKQELIFNFGPVSGPGSPFLPATGQDTANLKKRPCFSESLASEADRHLFDEEIQRLSS